MGAPFCPVSGRPAAGALASPPASRASSPCASRSLSSARKFSQLAQPSTWATSTTSSCCSLQRMAGLGQAEPCQNKGRKEDSPRHRKEGSFNPDRECISAQQWFVYGPKGLALTWLEAG